MTAAGRPGRPRPRGNVAIFYALTLPVLIGFAALVVDIGHLWMVQHQLQNAADAAALAGVRDLNGTAPQFLPARQSSQELGSRHRAHLTPVTLDLNLDNDATGNIVLGSWNFGSRTFTPAEATTPPYLVNAVQVIARRTAQEGGAVALSFARFLGIMESGVTATAIAVGGSPSGTCGFPLAVADCSIVDGNGVLRCNQSLTFGQATTDTVGFTIFSDSNPTTPTVTCMMARQLGSPCPTNCDCSQTCNATSTEDGEIKISNGNNLSETSVDNINNAVAQAGMDGVMVQVPVVASGLSSGECGSFNYNQPREVTGYVTMKLTGATFAPNKQITAEIDCTQSGPKPPGGAFYGYTSSTVYLVK